MKILFFDQAMNWWFADQYQRCDLPNGIEGIRFIFLRTNKLLKNRRVFFCCCGNGSAASFTTFCQPSLLDFFWLSFELPCSNIQNSDVPSRFCMRSNLFLLKSFSMTAFCLLVKTILLRSSELGNCETSQRRPVISIDYDLHCNGFLHSHDFFARRRRKKTN